MSPSPGWLVTNLIAEMLLPPLSLILLMGAGLWLLKRRPRLGRALLASGLALLYALSTPLVAATLFHLLQCDPLKESADLSMIDAIVVLGSGRYEEAPEYSGDTNSPLGLERLRYAAWLQRKTGLPLLAAGGSPDGRVPESSFMKTTLEREFQVPVRWTEDGSTNTLENARGSHRILAPLGVKNILLVTHAWHMPRAQLAFEKAGFTVTPAGTRFYHPDGTRLFDYVPDASALRSSSYALHEMLGILWYGIRY